MVTSFHHVTDTCNKGCGEITPFTALMIFPVFFSVIRISLGPRNAIALGALRPQTTSCAVKEVSLITGPSKATLALASVESKYFHEYDNKISIRNTNVTITNF